MTFYRAGDRIGCGLEPDGYSSLKKSAVLFRQYCLRCGYRCWIYHGTFRFIETKVKV